MSEGGSTPPLVVDGVWLDGTPLALTSIIDNLETYGQQCFHEVRQGHKKIFHYFPGSYYIH